MNSREQFEHWSKNEYGICSETLLCKDEYGGYIDDEIDGFWVAWQASRKALESAEV